MTWEDIKKLYEERTKKYAPHQYESAAKGLQKLEAELQLFFPEGLVNPELLLEPWGRNRPLRMFYNLYERDKKMSPLGYKALTRICSEVVKFKMLKSLSEYKRADDVIFHKRDVLYCCIPFLEKDGWKNIIPDYDLSATISVTAETGRKIFKGVALGSVKEKLNYKGPEAEMDAALVKLRLGRALFALMEKMNESENNIPALLIADDSATRSFVIPFSSYIKRIGIRIYMVNSVDRVHAL